MFACFGCLLMVMTMMMTMAWLVSFPSSPSMIHPTFRQYLTKLTFVDEQDISLQNKKFVRSF